MKRQRRAASFANSEPEGRTCKSCPRNQFLVDIAGVSDRRWLRLLHFGRMWVLSIEGFADIVQATAALPLPSMKQAIVDKVAAWRGGPPTDDTYPVRPQLTTQVKPTGQPHTQIYRLTLVNLQLHRPRDRVYFRIVVFIDSR